MGNEKRNIDEFHRGYVGGERHAVRKILEAIKGAPIESKAMLIQLLELVCRDELDIELKELEDNGG